MKKIKIIAFLSVLALMFGLLSAVAGAAVPVPQTANDCTVESYSSWREVLANRVADTANGIIEDMVVAAQNDPNANIDSLLATTNFISQSAIRIINALGFDATCTYVPYVINGVTVYIDPIIVIKR